MGNMRNVRKITNTQAKHKQITQKRGKEGERLKSNNSGRSTFFPEPNNAEL